MTQKDSFFTIGSTHKVCQDYALSGEQKGFSYALVGDGCSSSPNSDVGSRILLHLVEKIISGTKLPLSEFFLGLFESAREMMSQMGLPDRALDSTLLLASHEEGGLVNVEVLGDGFIAARKRGLDLFEYWGVYSFDNLPGYLRYLYEFPDDLHNLEREVFHWNGEEEVSISKEKLSYENYLYKLSLDPEEYDLICLLSDGAASFQERNSRSTSIVYESVPVKKILEQIMSVKGFKGEFITRRCHSFLKKWCKEKEWVHSDDFSVAALFLE